MRHEHTMLPYSRKFLRHEIFADDRSAAKI